MVGLRLNGSRRLWFALRFTFDLLQNLLPALFILGAALTLMAYTPVPPHFCKTSQWNAFASNQGGCDAMLVLFYKFSHAFLETQRMSGYVAIFGNLSYASSTSGVTFVSVRAMEQTPILINEVVRRIIQVLFTLSIVWPRLLEPRKVLRGSLNVDRRRNG